MRPGLIELSPGARETPYPRLRLVLAQLTVALTAGIVVGCTPPKIARQLEAAHPNAAYEATAQGCDWQRGSITRRFGRDAGAAVLWSRQVFGSARLVQCEIRIDAVTGEVRRPVYRLRRDAAGRVESVVSNPPSS